MLVFSYHFSYHFSQLKENENHGQEGFGIRGGDEVKAAIEQGTEELPGYREQSSSKRTVRTNRREQLESLNNPERDGSSSKPYGRDSTEDVGRNGSLVSRKNYEMRKFIALAMTNREDYRYLWMHRMTVKDFKLLSTLSQFTITEHLNLPKLSQSFSPLN